MTPLKDLGVHLALWFGLVAAFQLLVALTPDPALDRAVRSRYPGQAQVVLFAKSAFSGTHAYARRDYILLPRFLYDPALVEARNEDSGPVQVSESRGLAAFTGVALLLGMAFYFARRWRALRDST